MFTMPAIDMVATGKNIMCLREAAGLTVRDLQDIFGFATPVATCQGHIHHFSSLFLDFLCFPYSKSWRMTRPGLSSMLWVLVSEK